MSLVSECVKNSAEADARKDKIYKMLAYYDYEDAKPKIKQASKEGKRSYDFEVEYEVARHLKSLLEKDGFRVSCRGNILWFDKFWFGTRVTVKW